MVYTISTHSVEQLLSLNISKQIDPFHFLSSPYYSLVEY